MAWLFAVGLSTCREQDNVHYRFVVDTVAFKL